MRHLLMVFRDDGLHNFVIRNRSQCLYLDPLSADASDSPVHPVSSLPGHMASHASVWLAIAAVMRALHALTLVVAKRSNVRLWMAASVCGNCVTVLSLVR